MKVINNTGSALQLLVTQSGKPLPTATIVYSGSIGSNTAVEFDPKNAGEGPLVYVRSAETNDKGYILRKATNSNSTISLSFIEE